MGTMATATAMARSGTRQSLRTGAASEGFFSPKRAWLVAALLVGLVPSVSAQYGLTVPGSPGGGTRLGDPAPQQQPADPTKPETPGRSQRSWEIVPTLLVEETYTDNVRLGPSGSERGDWVTRLKPGVSVNGTGARLRFNVTYVADVVSRAQEGTNDIFHYLNARGDAELVRQLLFVDARASVSQQNVSLLGPQAESNVSDTGNRTTVRTFLVSPYLRHSFGTNSQGEARLTSSSVSSGGSASLANSESNRIDMKLASGPAFKLLTWNVAYNKERIDYTETNQSIDLEKISAGGKHLITPTLGLLANVGYEDNDYGPAAPAAKGKFWSWGPEWTPTPRTRLAATTGRRYFGPSHSLDFSHRTRLTTWRVEYNEDVTTTRGEFLVPTNVDTASFLDSLFLSLIPDPIARQIAVQNFITQLGLPASLVIPLNFVTTTPFIVKRLRASFGIQGVRNTVMANVFTEDRQAVANGLPSAGDFAQTPNIKQIGASLLWTLRLTSQTTSNASVGYVTSEFPGLAREDKLTYIRLGLTKQFQPKLTGTLSFRRLQNGSNQAGAGYTENAVSAALSMRF
jgi:uncharacterized protein (PEP-CTERM system associated)